MAATRTGRTAPAHNRMRKQVRLLSQEVERLGVGRTLDFEDDLSSNIPYAPSPGDHGNSPMNLDSLLDRILDLSKKWEKIMSLLALVTTNLSGNKSLSALLEIMAKDKNIPSSLSEDGVSEGASRGLNISELLNLAESLLKGSQQSQPMETVEVVENQTIENVEPVEAEVIDIESEASAEVDEGLEIIEEEDGFNDSPAVDENGPAA